MYCSGDYSDPSRCWRRNKEADCCRTRLVPSSEDTSDDVNDDGLSYQKQYISNRNDKATVALRGDNCSGMK